MPTPAAPVLDATLAQAGATAARQRIVNGWLARHRSPPGPARAVLAEGGGFGLQVPPDCGLAGFAAGCPCCLGTLPFRVELLRLLRRHRPGALLVVVSPATHLEPLAALLAGAELGLQARISTWVEG